MNDVTEGPSRGCEAMNDKFPLYGGHTDSHYELFLPWEGGAPSLLNSPETVGSVCWVVFLIHITRACKTVFINFSCFICKLAICCLKSEYLWRELARCSQPAPESREEGGRRQRRRRGRAP